MIKYGNSAAYAADSTSRLTGTPLIFFVEALGTASEMSLTVH